MTTILSPHLLSQNNRSTVLVRLRSCCVPVRRSLVHLTAPMLRAEANHGDNGNCSFILTTTTFGGLKRGSKLCLGKRCACRTNLKLCSVSVKRDNSVIELLATDCAPGTGYYIFTTASAPPVGLSVLPDHPQSSHAEPKNTRTCCCCAYAWGQFYLYLLDSKVCRG